MSANFLFLGDTMLGENFHHFNRGLRTKFSPNYRDIFKNNTHNEIFGSSDFVFFNMEYSLVPSDFLFNTINDSVYANDVHSLRIFPSNCKLVVNIANNHFSQHGVSRAVFTKNYLSKLGYTIVGADKNPSVIEVNNIKIKIWGVSLVNDKNYNDSYFISNYESLIEDLALCNHNKSIDEKWIISLHWGDEYIKNPNSHQIKLARVLADYGFDVIIGHHPHVYQSYENYKNTHIFYSLGNFIFDQNFSVSTQKGIVCSFDLSNKEFSLNTVKQVISSDYFISDVKNISITRLKHTSLSEFSYKAFLFFKKIKMRILMKYELLKNWKEVDFEVKTFFRNKLLNKVSIITRKSYENTY